jgi:hypothetical protein
MGLFNIFRTQKSGSLENKTMTTHDTSKEGFSEDRAPQQLLLSEPNDGRVRGIEEIYDFLQADYESKGYRDAFASPDESYKADNIKLFRQDLEILLLKVKTYYEDMINVLDFHISSRSRAGLVDLVEELNVKKNTVMEHIQKVDQLYIEMEQNRGITQRIALSYQRGFSHGLSALTQSQILNKIV